MTDLQVGVLIDDIKGRFCADCPNLFQRDKVSAVVTMNARWEVYSTMRGQVIARVTTNTGSAWRKPGVTDVPRAPTDRSFASRCSTDMCAIPCTWDS